MENQNEKVIGGWVLSNCGGVSVLAMNDESMTVRWYDDEETEECEILFGEHEDSEEGDDLVAYIEFKGRRLYLNECMRTNF